jgi:hypothetical protein
VLSSQFTTFIEDYKGGTTMRTLMCFMALTLVYPLCALGYTYHVQTGDSIQDSIDAASAGDSVVVHTGTYEEDITLKAGVTVCSAGDGEVTIDGGSATSTVYFSGNGSSGGYDLYFGGDARGFTIDGGNVSYAYGVYLLGVSNMHVRDLTIVSDSLYAPMAIFGAETSAHFREITIRDQTDADVGLMVTGYSGVIEELWVDNFPQVGVLLYQSGANPTLRDVEIDSCDIGISTFDSHPTVDETTGGESTVTNCRVGVSVHGHDWSSEITLDHVTIEDCETAVSTSAYGSRVGGVEADGCTIEDCEDGMILDKASGSEITGCWFKDIDDTAITITNNNWIYPVTIGGSGADANTFVNIDGDGISIGSGGYADIDRNEFDYVDGTAIDVQSGNDDTSIDDCDMDGSATTNSCYEGIYTGGSGTFVEVRACTLYDYKARTTPAPRGATANEATADYGTRTEWGYNSFEENSYDLFYSTKGSSPDSLYAVGNWWGEDPPDTDEFGGASDYIVYEPYIGETRLALPGEMGNPFGPSTLALTNAYPNPWAGTVELEYQIPSDGHVSFAIWDLQGRLVRVLIDEELEAGGATAVWDGADDAGDLVPSGVYLCQLRSPAGTSSRRIVLAR